MKNEMGDNRIIAGDLTYRYPEQERAAEHGLKALYESRVVENVERDLESGHVSMEPVEKRVQLDADACKVIIEGVNPTPIVYEPINVLMLAWESGMTNMK